MYKIKLLIGGLATVTALSLASPSFAAGTDCGSVDTVSGRIDNVAWGKFKAEQRSCAEKNNENNGWGNGDQAAPGSSLLNNNAENYCAEADAGGLLCVVIDTEGEPTDNPNGYLLGGSPSNSPASGG